MELKGNDAAFGVRKQLRSLHSTGKPNKNEALDALMARLADADRSASPPCSGIVGADGAFLSELLHKNEEGPAVMQTQR